MIYDKDHEEQKDYFMKCLIMHPWLFGDPHLPFFLSVSYGIDDSVVTYIWNLIAEDTFPHFPMSNELDIVMLKSRLIPSGPFLRLGAQETRFG